MGIKDLSLKLAAISLLADQAKRLKDELRAELQGEMNNLGADRVKAELGDEVIAYITTTKPKFKWVIKSDRKFIDWVKTNVPSEIVETVRDSSIDKILEKFNYLDDVVIEDADVDKNALLYLQLGVQIKELEKEQDSLKASFEGLLGTTNSGIELSWTTVRGRESVDSDEVLAHTLRSCVPYRVTPS